VITPEPVPVAFDDGAVAAARAIATVLASMLESMALAFEPATSDHPAVETRPALRVGARPIDPADEHRLHPGEAAIVESAVPKRRREFASGRSLLRSLLGTTDPVTVLTSRAPRLPDGVVASLAHDDEIAIAAISRDPRVRAIGIDLEPVDAVDADVAEVVRRPEELGLDPTWVFVVKEATYKAWSTMGGALLRHEDVSVTAGPDGGFRAEVLSASPGEHRSFTGRSATVGGRVVALVVVIGNDGPR
jgi:4'-phosphopantetheinyl transferase EntD